MQLEALDHLVDMADRLHAMVKSKYTNRHLSTDVREASTRVQWQLSESSIVRLAMSPRLEPGTPSLEVIDEGDGGASVVDGASSAASQHSAGEVTDKKCVIGPVP